MGHCVVGICSICSFYILNRFKQHNMLFILNSSLPILISLSSGMLFIIILVCITCVSSNVCQWRSVDHYLHTKIHYIPKLALNKLEGSVFCEKKLEMSPFQQHYHKVDS